MSDLFVGSSVRHCYNRVVVGALSTNAGFSCRIDTSSKVVVWTTRTRGISDCSARKPERAGIRDQKAAGLYRHIRFQLRSLNSTILLLESLSYHVPGQFRIGLHAHLFENPCTVGADRRDAQVRRAGDLTDGFSRADEAQHLVF